MDIERNLNPFEPPKAEYLSRKEELEARPNWRHDAEILGARLAQYLYRKRWTKELYEAALGDTEGEQDPASIALRGIRKEYLDELEKICKPKPEERQWYASVFDEIVISLLSSWGRTQKKVA